MAKQQSSETFKLPLRSGKARQARRGFRLEVFSRFEAETWVLVVVSILTAYLVLPPLYSVIQTSLFTTRLTGARESAINRARPPSSPISRLRTKAPRF
ncbi:MAG TPA: hypothetical protein VI479_06430 [Blastocatellia bacterium]